MLLCQHRPHTSKRCYHFIEGCDTTLGGPQAACGMGMVAMHTTLHGVIDQYKIHVQVAFDIKYCHDPGVCGREASGPPSQAVKTETRRRRPTNLKLPRFWNRKKTDLKSLQSAT